MATAAPAATSSPSTSSGAGADSTSPSSPSSPSPSTTPGRPAYESEGSFFGTEAQETAPDTETDEAAADPSAPVDPDTLFTQTLESLSPEQRTVLEQRDHNLRRQAGRAAAAQKQTEANYSAAEAWAGMAQIAIQRLKGAGIDTSDLEAGEAAGDAPPSRTAAPAPSDFDAAASTNEALATLDDGWNNRILDAQDQADELARASADFEAAGDAAKATLFKKQARDLRFKITQAIAHSAVMAASKIAERSHSALAGRFGQLEGKLTSEESAVAGHAAMGNALHAASMAIDEASGTRLWFDRGFFANEGGKVVLTPLARELTEPMQAWAEKRGADLSNPDDFNDAFWASMGRAGKLRRGGAATRPVATPTPGDPTSSLVGPGTLSPAVPRRQPTSALPAESADERAARTNRRAMGA